MCNNVCAEFLTRVTTPRNMCMQGTKRTSLQCLIKMNPILRAKINVIQADMLATRN